MDHQEWQVRSRSFGTVADLYDRVRPTYPPQALRWILGPAAASNGGRPLRVVDLGAGTGILTRVLLGLGPRTIGELLPVEPDPGMAARLVEATPGVVARGGTAEAIDLPDGSVDAVVAGQAYHWFDHDRAHLEIARVLRPGGVFGPVWNDRDDTTPWLAELTRIAEGLAQADDSRYLTVGPFGPWFTPVEQAMFGHSTTHTVDSLLELVKSRSSYITASPGHRTRMEAGVRELVATHPDIAGREPFEVPYVTRAYRSVRLP